MSSAAELPPVCSRCSLRQGNAPVAGGREKSLGAAKFVATATQPTQFQPVG